MTKKNESKNLSPPQELVVISNSRAPKLDDEPEATEALLPTTNHVEIKPKKKKSKEKEEVGLERKSGIVGLFRYASAKDIGLMAIGSLFAIVHGAGMPVLALVFGQMTNTFILQSLGPQQNLNVTGEVVLSKITSATTLEPDPFSNFTDIEPPKSAEDFTKYMTQFSIYYALIGLGVLTAGFVQTLCWELACERQVYKLRRKFFSQLLRQDVTWYDKQKGGDLTTKLSDDLERVREGIGSKMSMVLQYVSAFFSGLAVGLYSNMKLTLIILAVSPILIATSAYMARTASSSAAREQLKYSIAGKIAEEVLTSIRTVVAYGGEDKEVKRYEDGLEEGRRLAMRKYYILSTGIAAVFFVIYATYGLAFWFGAEMIRQGEATPGSVFTVFFSVMAGAFALGNALPFVNAVSTATGAAGTIFHIIDRVPVIDSYSSKGVRPEKVKGHIRFEDVKFRYPARPDVSVLSDLTLDIEPGKTVALVGSSGAGKSTIVSLLLRHYDPLEGKILLDERDIRDLNIEWLRSQIGLVSQEPILFGVSIEENIRYGRDDCTRDDIVNAAKMANAHKFITALPMGYETLVGERGTQLSGGQKQRIAIARALVRDPKILLLDEATSALDSQNEAEVQKALDKAMANRTTIIVAHRLSTIKNANIIYAMKDGSISEWGTHNELMLKKGLYYNLVTSQNKAHDEDANQSTFSDVSDVEDIKTTSPLSKSTQSLDQIHADSGEAPKVEVFDDISMWQLLTLNAAEWPWLTVGFIGCILTGSVMPIFAYFYGEIFSTFQLTGEELRQTALFWTYMFIVLAVGSGFSYAFHTVAMVTAAEKLVMRIRLVAFDNILRQAIGWFDLDQHSSGRLITRLARDAPLIKAAAGLRAGQFVSAGVTLIAALIIAFINGWKLACLLIVAAPIIMGASYQQMMILRRNQRRDAHLMDSAGRVASESIQNIRTVQALGRETLFLNLYLQYLIEPFREAKKQALIYGIVFGFSQAVIFFMYAGAFRFGAYLIEINDMTASQVYRVFFALAFCAASVGQSSAYLQDFTKAKLSAGLMFQLINAKTQIDGSSCYGVKPVIQGKISFKKVCFRYPARPDVEVLKGADLEVEFGQTVALVGASGGGKSTFVALLQRFYDPDGGSICVDDMDIRTLNLPYLRSCMGLVTQEPSLFDLSIKDNIAYGAGSVEMADIIKAAKDANIHEFIVGLPQGYDTMVGERGTQLSGGQKQRIAIARALIRNPKILLLDEATSALDTESEQVVQEALERARAGRTCIIIAHRLSTIENADNIAVLHNGAIVAKGTHAELMNEHGLYYELVKRQKM